MNYQPIVGGQAKPVEQLPESDAGGYAALIKAAQVSKHIYETVKNLEGIVPWGRDSTQRVKVLTGDRRKRLTCSSRVSPREFVENFCKVVDCSDVILHITDARNVPGTRCTKIEKHIAKNASHKHFRFCLEQN